MSEPSILDGRALMTIYAQLSDEQQAELEALARRLLEEQEADTDTTTYVYRVYDAQGTLLYVGKTDDIEQRMYSHFNDNRFRSPWCDDAADVVLEGFDSPVAAARAEMAAVAEEFPRWNIKGRSPLHPDGPASCYRAVAAKFDMPWRPTLWDARRASRAQRKATA